MRTRRKIATVATMAVLALLLGACSGSSRQGTGEPKFGGVLTVGLESPWVSLDPAKVTTFNGLSAQRAIYDGLFTPDASGELVPTLATGYEVSPDGLTYTVTVRDGVKFQDGTSLDAAAVKTSLDRMCDPATASTSAYDTSVIAAIEAPTSNQVVITLSTPSAGFATAVLAGPAGFIISPAALAKPDADIANNPVGAGPFKFKDQVSGDSLSLVKWDGYWQPDRPYLDGVKFKVIPDEQARYASVSSNSIQVAENVSTTSVKNAELDGTLVVTDLGGVGSEFVQFQSQAAPFDDPRARQAATMAIDTGAISETLFHGLKLTGQESPFPKDHPYDPGSVDGYPSFNRAKAKSLVKELGGLSFALKVINRPENVRIAQALVSLWDAANIKVTIVQVDSPTGVQDARNHQFEAMLYRWRGSFDPAGNVNQFFGSDSADPNVPSSNGSLTSDPAVDGAIVEGDANLDPTARKAAYQKLDEALANYAPYCWLWAANWFRLTTTAVYGIPKLPDSVGIYTDAYLN